jgi:hypothetical protein
MKIVHMTIKELAELLIALSEGSKTTIHGDELGAMFPASKEKTVVLDSKPRPERSILQRPVDAPSLLMTEHA